MTNAAPVDQAPQSMEDRAYALFDPSPGDEAAKPLEMAEPEVEGADDPEAEEPTPEPAEGEETVEIEYDGQKVVVPKFLEPAILKNADYTQKTQELARQREIVEHQQKAMEASRLESEFMQVAGPVFEQLYQTEAKVKQLQAIDPRTLPPEEMMLHVYELNEARRQQAELKDQVTAKRSEFDAKYKERMNGLRESAKETLKKQIPTLTDESFKDALSRAKDYGYTADDVEAISTDPRALALLYKAARFDQLQAKSAKVVSETAPVLKAGPSNPMPQQVRDKLNYRKAIKSVTNSQAKERIIAKRLEGMF